MPAPALPARAARRPALRVLLPLAALLALTSCTGSDRPAARPSGSTAPLPVPSVTLPADPLRALVPRPDDVPSGLLPVVPGSGPRDLAAVAAFSGDPAAAGAALRAHGFTSAYVAQYAEPPGAQGRVLSVVVARFATLKGAADDLSGDVAASGTGEPADVGQGASLRVQALPGGSGQLTTLRFRVGVRTWLLAYGAAEADRETVLALGRTLAERASGT